MTERTTARLNFLVSRESYELPIVGAAERMGFGGSMALRSAVLVPTDQRSG